MEVVNYLRNLHVNYACNLRKLQTVPISGVIIDCRMILEILVIYIVFKISRNFYFTIILFCSSAISKMFLIFLFLMIHLFLWPILLQLQAIPELKI